MRQGRPLFRRFSLRSQLIAAFLIVGLVGMGLLAFIYIRTTRQALIGEANQTLYAAASRTATSLDVFIKTNLEAIRVEGSLPSMSAVEFAPKVGGVYFYFSSPVRNKLGQIVGVLRSRYSVSVLQRLVSESRGLAGDGSFAILLDENGLRLAHDQAPELIFKSVVPLEPTRQLELQAAHRLPNLAEAEMATNWPEFAQSLANANAAPFFAAKEHTSDHLEQMAVVSLATQPWQVAYVLPQDVFLAPIERAIQITVAWTAVFTVFLVAAAVWVARWLTKPVVQLTAVTEQIAAGDLTAQAEVTSDDEIGQLAVAFNNMTAQLRQTLEGLEKREDALQESNEQLESALIELQETQSQMMQQERVAAVGQLAAGIAHDFNNIMATVILYSDLLLKTGRLPEKERKRIAIIREQGQRAADLTQQILDFSRKSIMQRQDLDLWYFLVEMRSLLVRTLPENIRFALISEGNHFMVNGDPTRLQQVILNLVINARNAMPDGGDLRLRLSDIQLQDDSLLPDMEPGAWVRLAVSDTGAGIPDDVVAHIFEPFFTTRGPLGSGLGLSQVDGIVKQHGGGADEPYLNLLTMTEKPGKYFNQLGLTMLSHDFGVNIVRVPQSQTDRICTQLFIPNEEFQA